MKYALYENGTNDKSDVIAEVLRNRGVDDCEAYLHLTQDCVQPYSDLDNMYFAAHLFNSCAVQPRGRMAVLVDSDPDGYCSAAMLCLYIKRMWPDYPVEYVMHRTPKAHGLMDDVDIPDGIELLIIPDAGTNDVAQCEKLVYERGPDFNILVLDHHEMEERTAEAYKDIRPQYRRVMIVNNQSSSNYKNKDLSGAGVVYRFLQALDEMYKVSYADDYLDLCALANISDVMDLRSFETRYLVNTGIKHIKNKCFAALLAAQDYAMCGRVTVHNIQWYVTPILNACIRIGTLEEKELLFRAFIEQDEIFEYKKRATKDRPAETVQESIYDRAARTCKNIKARQDRMKEKSVSEIVSLAEKQETSDKVVMTDVTDVLDEGLTGVVAIKIAEHFHKPCILLRRHDADNGEAVYGGSARNVNHSPIPSFKDVVNGTGVMQGLGHASAFGIIGLPVSERDAALQKLNELLKDVEYDATYHVDFIFNAEPLLPEFVYEVSKFDEITCQGIEEPMVAVEGLYLYRNEFEIFGKNEDTVSFMLNDVKYIMFRCREGNPLYDFLQNAWDDNDAVEFTIVGRPSMNDYNGVRTPQFVIDDVDVLNTYDSDGNAANDGAGSRTDSEFEYTDDDDAW